MKNDQNLTVRYAFLPGFYWMSFSAVMGFSSFYLLSQGLTNTQIGLVTAIASSFSAILQPIVAGYADRPNSLSIKQIVLAVASAMMLLSVALLFCFDRIKVGTTIFYALAILFLQLITPLVNALGTESIHQGKKINYGACRSVGSLGYAILAFILGKVTAVTGAIAVPAAILLVYTALFIALLCFPFKKVKREETVTKKESKGGITGFIRKYPRYMAVLCGCILIYISHNFLNNFTLQIVTSKGGTSVEMGIAQSFASVIELPVMFCFGWMLKKKSSDFWFRISGIFFFLKTLATWMAPNIPVFYTVQLFQIFGWALMTVASVFYVSSIMEDEDAIKGQAFYTMTFTVGTVIGSIIGGILLDKIGVSSMLFVGTLASFIGMLIIFCFGKVQNSSYSK